MSSSLFLLPANEVCKGYVFTPVCQSFCSQGGCLLQYMLGYIPPSWEQTPPPEQTPLGADTPRIRHPLGADTPQSSACREIWATSGRYASYWNAYLFSKIDLVCPVLILFDVFLVLLNWIVVDLILLTLMERISNFISFSINLYFMNFKTKIC